MVVGLISQLEMKSQDWFYILHDSGWPQANNLTLYIWEDTC